MATTVCVFGFVGAVLWFLVALCLAWVDGDNGRDARGNQVWKNEGAAGLALLFGLLSLLFLLVGVVAGLWRFAQAVT